jgi:predicted PurR-regulated permease PerM
MSDVPMSDVAEAPTDPPPVDLDWRVGVVVAVTAALIGVIIGLVRSAPRTFTWIVIGGLLTLALDPLVDAAQRRLGARRGVGVAVVFGTFFAVAAGLLLLLGPPAAEQARNLSDELPDVVDNLTDLPVIGDDLARNDVPDRVQEWIEGLPAQLSGDTTPIEGVARSVVGGALAAVATLLITLALLLDGARLVRAVRRLVPVERRPTADRFGDLSYRIVGKYFAGSLLVAALAGVVTLIIGTVLGVPLTPLLAVNVAVFNLVPQIGGAVGGIPFVLFAFTQGATTGVLAAGFFVLYLQFENHVLTPIVVGDAVDLSPPATMVSALVGVSVAGVPGALVAVPFLGAAKAFYLELRRSPDPLDGDDLPEIKPSPA